MTGPFPNIEGFDSLAQLGGGGMGNVYLAREQGLYGFEKLWAIKLIRPNMVERSEFRAMFMDEARLMARLQHAAIPQLHRFGEADEMLYMVMEYVAGESFAAILGNGTPSLPPLIASSLVAKVCRGLHAAHEVTDDSGTPMNVVHRDVSPSNLVLTYEGGVKILDFGIALMRERRAPVTDVGVVKGKPSYLAPEQFYRWRTDRRADIFSASIVLWELLTRKKLIDTMDLLELGFDRALEQAVCAPSQIAGPLPSGLDALVLRGLAKNPDDRFESAREMARELEALIEREGCEPLEEFAERELRELRSQHESRVRELRAGNGSLIAWQPPPITQVETDPGGAVTTQPVGLGALDAKRTHVLPQLSRPRSRQKIVVLAAIALVALISSWFFAGLENEAARVPPPHVSIPAATAPLPEPVEEVVPPVQEVARPQLTKKEPRRSVTPAKRRARRERIRASKPPRENSPQKKPAKGLISEW